MFLLDGSKNFVTNDIVVATGNVNIREAAFGNFTQTWLKFLSPPEPKIIGIVTEGDCVMVIGFISVGFNRVWMEIERADCPIEGNG